jgi:hypothetical protein
VYEERAIRLWGFPDEPFAPPSSSTTRFDHVGPRNQGEVLDSAFRNEQARQFTWDAGRLDNVHDDNCCRSPSAC